MTNPSGSICLVFRYSFVVICHHITTDAHFVDAMRKVLIQKVSSVMPIADELLQKKHISSEEYANIRERQPEQEKMREIYKTLNNPASKVAFYGVLQKYDPYLLDDLERDYERSAGPYCDVSFPFTQLTDSTLMV